MTAANFKIVKELQDGECGLVAELHRQERHQRPPGFSFVFWKLYPSGLDLKRTKYLNAAHVPGVLRLIPRIEEEIDILRTCEGLLRR